jgi:hypothetical protein
MAMPYDHRSAGAHIVRMPRRGRTLRARRRAWRRRSRKAQVAAVATILGLLLVVTFIANYITTTLPSTMGQNDLQHEVTVQNQVAQLSALLEETAESGAVSAQVSQPVTLGSAGAPPFAGPDSSSISPGNLSSGLGVSFTLTGPSVYAPPGFGGPLGVNFHPTSVTCKYTPPATISVTGTCNTFGNLSGNSQSFSISLTGSLFDSINVTTNSSTITVAGVGSGGNHFEFIGSHNTITMTAVGSSLTNVSIIGSYDTLSISTTGSSPIVVYIYGNHDSVTFPTTTGSQAIKVVDYGTSDTFSAPTATGSDTFSVYFNGFNATAPTSSLCPYQNLSSTDVVTGYNSTGSGGLTEYLNNAVGYYANATGAATCTGNSSGTYKCWAIHSRNVPLSACPFFSALVLPISGGKAPPSASLLVQLRNTYAPSAEVALDQGAVVYAQPGSIPVFVVPPPLTYAKGVLSIFVPQFSGRVGSEAGVGTADVSLRLLSTEQLVIPSSGFSFQSSSTVTITIVTPYASAWAAYFLSVPSLAPLLSCPGASSCTALSTTLYSPGGHLGTLTLTVPTAGLKLNLLVGLYAVTIA